MNSHTVYALGGMISRLVVDRIAYLTTISLLGIEATLLRRLVKLRRGSFFNKINNIVLYYIETVQSTTVETFKSHLQPERCQ